MPAYFVLLTRINDQAAYAEYARLASAATAAFGGRRVIRAPITEVLEGHLAVKAGTRLVILEFDSIEQARGWWNSDDYQQIIGLRQPPVAEPLAGFILEAGAPDASRRGEIAAREATDPVRIFIEHVWNQRKLEKLGQITTTDYTIYNLSDGSIAARGRQALRQHIQQWIEAFPDLHMDELDAVEGEDRVATILRVTGTHTGSAFGGVEPAQRPIDLTIAAIFDTDGEKLRSHSTLVDASRLRDQLAARDA